MDAQLLLYVFGEEESGTGVSTQAVRYDEDHWASTGPHVSPAWNTHSFSFCLDPSYTAVLFMKSHCWVSPEDIMQASWLSVELVWELLQEHRLVRKCDPNQYDLS